MRVNHEGIFQGKFLNFLLTWLQQQLVTLDFFRGIDKACL